MIGKNGKGFISAHWDWLLLAAAVAVLAGAAAWFFAESSVDPEAAAEEETRSLDAMPVTAKPVEKVDMTALGIALKSVLSPSTIPEPADSGSYLASPSRMFCEQGDPAEAETRRSCGKPIPFRVKTCPFCGAKQPEEQKVKKLDSDGDGLDDETEIAHGLDPRNPMDAGADNDGDGFTNSEEIAAGTNPNDRTSHPEYVDFLVITPPFKTTRLELLFERVSNTRSGMKFYFKNPKELDDWKKPGKMYSVVAGEPIGKTGFSVKSYEAKTERVEIAKGSSARRDIDRSVVVLERASDRKTVSLTVGSTRYADIDIQATISYSRDAGKVFSVVKGDTFSINGEQIMVQDISRDGKTDVVTVRNTATGAVKTLTALEQ